MVRRKQLLLPAVDKVKKIVAYPQPRKVKLSAPKKFELLHHPFDLAFRGKINKWLKQLVVVKGKTPEKLLDNESFKIIKLYFYPDGAKNKWLNQEEILERTEVNYKKKLRQKLVDALLAVWQKTRK